MKVKAKRRKKRIVLLADISEAGTQTDSTFTKDIVRVQDHHLELYVDIIDMNTISAGWVFTHNGQYYGDYIRYKGGVKDNTTQMMKDAIILLIDQQALVRKELNDEN